MTLTLSFAFMLAQADGTARESMTSILLSENTSDNGVVKDENEISGVTAMAFLGEAGSFFGFSLYTKTGFRCGGYGTTSSRP